MASNALGSCHSRMPPCNVRAHASASAAAAELSPPLCRPSRRPYPQVSTRPPPTTPTDTSMMHTPFCAHPPTRGYVPACPAMGHHASLRVR
eukprot:2972691-Prymnesium_polylepis.1